MLENKTNMADTSVNENLCDRKEFDLKKTIVTERLQKREEERISSQQLKKAEKQDLIVTEETTEFFKQEFSKFQNDIEIGLCNVDGIDQSDKSEYLDGLVLQVQKLQKFLTSSTQFLSPFNLQKAQDTINHLKVSIEGRRQTVAPKKKFAFKSGKKKGADNVDKVDAIISNKPTTSCDTEKANCHDISNLTGENLSKSSDEVDAKDVGLSYLTDCSVKLFGSPNALHFNKLVNCRIFTGPVSGSILVESCEGCTFVVACQQLRIHTTMNSQFYIHVTCRAIIEDSKDVSFAPYNWNYERINDDYARSGLNRDRNNWDCVDDFNWLVSDVHSPNWSLLEEAKRVVEWQ